MSVMGPGRERGARVAFAAASGLSRLARDIGLADRAVVAHHDQGEQLRRRGRRPPSPSDAPSPAWRANRARRGRPPCRLRASRCGRRGSAPARCRASCGRRPAAAGQDWPVELQDLVAFRRGAQHRIARAAADVGRERNPHAGVAAAAPDRTGRSRETGSTSGRTRRPTGSPRAPPLRRLRDECNGRTPSADRAARRARKPRDRSAPPGTASTTSAISALFSSRCVWT